MYCINGAKLPDSEFSIMLSHIQMVRLKYGSQLDNMIKQIFHWCNIILDGVTPSTMISKSIQQIETSTEVQQHTLNFLSEQLTLLFFHRSTGRTYINRYADPS